MVKEVARVVFWPIFIIVFVAAAFFIGNSVYDIQVEQMFDGDLGSEVIVSDAVFSCESTQKDVGYVYIHGFGDHSIGAFDYQRRLIGDLPILDFDYNEKLPLEDISRDFVLRFNSFAVDANLGEIVIIAQSAGGVIAAESVSSLRFAGPIELHTLASPLRGYHAPKSFLGDLEGFGLGIALGLDAYATPAENVKVYHHKTVVDTDLEAHCRGLCDALGVQNNNLVGSKEFFYEQFTHTSIIHPVSKMIIDCHT